MIENILFLPKTSQDSTSLARHFCQESSKEVYCIQVRSGKELSWSRTLRSWKIWTRQKSMLEDSMHRKSLCRKDGEKIMFSIADVGKKSWNPEDPPQFGTTVHETKSTTMFFKESRTGLNHWTRWRMTVKLETHHAEPRVKLLVPSEGSFPIPHEADEYDIGCVAGKLF